jgi:hypothetical protein
MPSIISIHDAKVRTMTVGIKAMTINDRQVTLAVFRQLLKEDLINYPDGTLAGIPWGLINYHPDKCEDEHNPHIHVVWQKGKELRRDTVYEKRVLGREEEYPNVETYRRACLYVERHNKALQKLRRLPQLFIAV